MQIGSVASGDTPDNPLHIRATADPIKLEGLQAGTATDAIVVADADGVLKTIGATDFGTGPWDNPDGTVANQVSTDINFMNGNVGIGIAAPSARFDVVESTNLGTTAGEELVMARFGQTVGTNRLNVEIKNIRDVDGTGWPNTRTRLGYHVDENANQRMWMDFNAKTNTTDNAISFGEGESEEWMRIENGRLGIRNINPSEALVIGDGTVGSEERILVNGDLYSGMF